MVLEQHRSSLIPTVSFGAGGRILVNGDGGTFPLSHGKRRDHIPDFKTNDKVIVDVNENNLTVDTTDVESFRSYDPKRKPRFLKRETSRYGDEVAQISGTLSSGGSQSLQRKLRRFRGRDKPDEDGRNHSGPTFGSLNLTGTMSDRGRRSRRSYQAPAPYPGSLGRSSGKRKNKQRLSVGTLRSSKRHKDEVYSKHRKSPHSHHNGYLADIPETVLVRNKKMAEETLPSLFFLISGGLMFVLALIKLLLSWWHAYWAPLWTACSVLALGIAGVLHRGDYLTKWRNVSYILFGMLSIVTTLLCCGILLDVSGPQVVQLGSGFTAEAVSLRSNFTNSGKSLVGNMNIHSVVTLNLGIDFAIIVLCMANFYSLTATIVAISNHWDAVYTTTGDCDHRGNPRLFNPMEQAILGLISCFLGLIAMAFTGYENTLYGIPAIAGGLIIAAGFSSFFYGKRLDLVGFGLVALILEFLALAACGVATIFLTLALVRDAQLANTKQIPSELLGVEPGAALQSLHSAAIVTIVAIGLYFIMMIVNVIFASGLLFRVCRKACCVCPDGEQLMNESRF